MTALGLVTVVVRDYDEAIDFYVHAAGFELVEDTDLGDRKRWVVVRPPGAETGVLLARAVSPGQRAHVADQTGGVAFFLHTDDFERDYAKMRERGVHFVETPRYEAYGIVAVFEDLYQNRWDLLEPKGAS